MQGFTVSSRYRSSSISQSLFFSNESNVKRHGRRAQTCRCEQISLLTMQKKECFQKANGSLLCLWDTSASSHQGLDSALVNKSGSQKHHDTKRYPTVGSKLRIGLPFPLYSLFVGSITHCTCTVPSIVYISKNMSGTRRALNDLSEQQICRLCTYAGQGWQMWRSALHVSRRDRINLPCHTLWKGPPPKCPQQIKLCYWG